MANRKLIFALLTLASLAACRTNSPYTPLQLDEKSMSYPTEISLDDGELLTFDTSVDPTTFPVVVLNAYSNFEPTIFEFEIRQALAQLDCTHVYNAEEFKRYAADKKFELVDGSIDGGTMQRFSHDVAPVLQIDAHYLQIDGPNTKTVIKITDGRTGKVLLLLDHPKLNWHDTKASSLYPVLNEMRHWYNVSAKKST